IVAALIDGETSLKRCVVERGRPYLKAENPRYPDLVPARGIKNQGVVVSLIRKKKRPERHLGQSGRVRYKRSLEHILRTRHVYLPWLRAPKLSIFGNCWRSVFLILRSRQRVA